MTAKEMFEKLGYTLCVHERSGDIEYRAIFSGFEFVIVFTMTNKWMESYVWTRWETAPFLFDVETLKAVNAQLKELGWLE